MHLRRILVILAILASTLAAIASPAAACSCEERPALEQLRSSEAALLGTYVGRGTPADIEGDTEGEIGYLFWVESYLKGDFSTPTLYVASAEDGSACGFETHPGDYLAVFMYGTEDGIPNGGLCGYIEGNAAKASLGDTIGVAPIDPSEATPESELPGDATDGPANSADPESEAHPHEIDTDEIDTDAVDEVEESKDEVALAGPTDDNSAANMTLVIGGLCLAFLVLGATVLHSRRRALSL